jgi:arsenical-resistance protein 2
MVLEGGIKGWVKAGPQYTQYMDGYQEEYWKDLFAAEDKTKEDAAGGAIVASAVGEGDVGK